MTPRLLIVEDDENLLAAMVEFFKAHKFDVTCAQETEEAVAIIKHQQFDIVVMDLELSSIEGLDGFGVLKAIRQSSVVTKVIVYSGHTEQAIVNSALSRGACRFVPKQASLSRVLSCVEELCQKSY